MWKKGLAEPLWATSSLEPERAGQISLSRMNKRQENMEKMVAMRLLVYAVALLIGENLPDRLYGLPIQPQERVDLVPHKTGQKWRRYLDVFILLKRTWWLLLREWQAIVKDALASFAVIVHPTVLTHV